MGKTVYLNKTVYENFKNDTEGLSIMEQAGFKNIVKPNMLMTAGRIVTITQGTKMQNLSIERVIKLFESHGYTVR